MSGEVDPNFNSDTMEVDYVKYINKNILYIFNNHKLNSLILVCDF